MLAVIVCAVAVCSLAAAAENPSGNEPDREKRKIHNGSRLRDGLGQNRRHRERNFPLVMQSHQYKEAQDCHREDRFQKQLHKKVADDRTGYRLRQ